MPVKTANDLSAAARLFHALADEIRLEIIQQLLNGEQCVCDLTDLLNVGQSRLSFHLRTLREAGLLKDPREGRWIYYSLHTDALEHIRDVVGQLKAGERLKVISKCYRGHSPARCVRGREHLELRHQALRPQRPCPS